jgi:hypothetical protein
MNEIVARRYVVVWCRKEDEDAAMSRRRRHAMVVNNGVLGGRRFHNCGFAVFVFLVLSSCCLVCGGLLRKGEEIATV